MMMTSYCKQASVLTTDAPGLTAAHVNTKESIGCNVECQLIEVCIDIPSAPL